MREDRQGLPSQEEHDKSFGESLEFNPFRTALYLLRIEFTTARVSLQFGYDSFPDCPASEGNWSGIPFDSAA